MSAPGSGSTPTEAADWVPPLPHWRPADQISPPDPAWQHPTSHPTPSHFREASGMYLTQYFTTSYDANIPNIPLLDGRAPCEKTKKERSPVTDQVLPPSGAPAQHGDATPAPAISFISQGGPLPHRKWDEWDVGVVTDYIKTSYQHPTRGSEVGCSGMRSGMLAPPLDSPGAATVPPRSQCRPPLVGPPAARPDRPLAGGQGPQGEPGSLCSVCRTWTPRQILNGDACVPCSVRGQAAEDDERWARARAEGRGPAAECARVAREWMERPSRNSDLSEIHRSGDRHGGTPARGAPRRQRRSRRGGR